MLYNSEVLKVIAAFREFNDKGEGDVIESDEYAAVNTQADILWMLVHFIFLWLVLLLLLEYQLPCCCCFNMRRIHKKDNLQYFDSKEENNDSNSESSEVANFYGQGQEL